MRLPIAILVAVLAPSALALGTRRCSWGPSYWCESLPQSSECAATQHCIQKYWTQLELPEDNDDVCKICLEMVKEARDQLLSNETESELKQVFDGSCDLIPVEIIATECKKLSEDFIVQLVETLASEMNPQVVCATAGLCNNARVDSLLAEYYSTRTECDVCKHQSAVLAHKIQKMAQDDVVDKLLEVCGYAGSYSDACKTTVLDNFDVIYGMLTDIGDGKLCQLVGICSETFANQLATYNSNPSNAGDVQCEFCEKVIDHWVTVWTANTTEDEFKTVLDALCHKMAKPERVQRCLHIVDDYYLPWLNFLLHEVDSHEICSLVGLCSASGDGFMRVDPRSSITVLLASHNTNDDDEESAEHLPLTPLSPANRITGREFHRNDALGELDPSQGLIGGYFVPQTELAASKPGCVICEYVLKDIDDYLADNRTEAAVESAVEGVCQRLPQAVRDQCSNLVDTYAPALIKMLVLDLDPSEVCKRLSLCDGSLLKQQVSMPTTELQLLRRSQDSCALCEMVFETAYSMLNDSTDQHEIQNVLDTICYHLPSSISNECEKLVSEFTVPALELLLNSVSPDLICKGIKMCPKAEDDLPPTKADQKCVLCEYIITTLDKMVSDKHNEEEVKAALDKMCSVLPQTLSDKCTQFVDTYSDMIIDLITHDVTPDQVCQSLGLCDASAEELANEVLPTVEELEVERPYCTLCEYAIGEVDKLLTDKKNEEEIKGVLDSICAKLTAPIKKECTLMVNKYADEIIDMFVAEYTPAEICQELKLCKPTVASLHSNDIPPLDNDFSAIPVQESTVSQKPFCAICEFGVDVLEKKLLTNRTVDMTERAVQMLCSYLPQSVADPCTKFVDDYGDELIKLIVEQELAPEELCTEMQLCVSQNQLLDETTRRLGGHRCAWGPSYWCQSYFHATACDTLEHCRANGWEL